MKIKHKKETQEMKNENNTPVAKQIPHKISVHGDLRNDSYNWLRASNWKDVMRDPQVLPQKIREYLEAENAYIDCVMADTNMLQGRLLAEMRGRIKEDDSSVPKPHGLYVYYTRYRDGGQHPILCRKLKCEGKEEVLFDGDHEAKGNASFHFGGATHSPCHSLLVYAVDLKGSERYSIHVRDIKQGKDISDEISDTSGGTVWDNDSKSFFYTKLDKNQRSRWVYRHRIGDAQDKDELIYEETNSAFFIGVGKSESERFIFIGSFDHETSEVRFLDLENEERGLVLLATRRRGVEYDVSHEGDRFLILTNADGAEDFKIVEAPITTPDYQNWKDFIPHSQRVLVVGILVFENYLVRLEREHALPRIVIKDLCSGEEHEISFEEEAYALGMSSGFEFTTDTLYFSYSSPTTPEQEYKYNMKTCARVLVKKQEVPSGHNPDDYITRRVFAKSEDGVQIPVTLLYRKETPIDGSAPLFLYGYGAYGISMSATFSTARLSLVDRGFVYAIAHVRGGTECGYRWYTDAKKEKKQNTFRDFITVAEYLIERRYTQKGRIAICGGSAGGMLIGAVLNMRPDLWGAAIAVVPFVDVLNTILDDTLPLTPPEWQEWGNPIKDKDAYFFIKEYSPYDNIRKAEYPPLLAIAGLTDPRVTYWEPAKWIARLRVLNPEHKMILLKTHMEHGHQGASGRLEALKDTALMYAFVLNVLKKT